VRREDVSDGPAAENGGAHRLDGERCGEEPLARAQDDRVDDKALLVDQAGLDQRSGEPYAALGEQVSVGALLLEARDGFGQVSGGDPMVMQGAGERSPTGFGPPASTPLTASNAQRIDPHRY
jgi:hypothetical protein